MIKGKKKFITGEGGKITNDDDSTYQQCRMLRIHGMQRRYFTDMLGYSSRMTDLYAAIGLVQFDLFDDYTAKRRDNTANLNANILSVITPKVKDGYGHAWYHYTIRTKNEGDEAVKQLTEAVVSTDFFYPIPAHQHWYIAENLGGVYLPVAEQLAKEVISLLVHPRLSQADLAAVVNAVNNL